MRWFIAFVTCVGCASARARYTEAAHPERRWIGKDESEMVTSMGAPNLSAKLSDGRSVYTWTSFKEGQVADVSVPGGMRTVHSECKITATIGLDAKVQAVSASGC